MSHASKSAKITRQAVEVEGDLTVTLAMSLPKLRPRIGSSFLVVLVQAPWRVVAAKPYPLLC
jgi:uncharacterized protein YqhQ